VIAPIPDDLIPAIARFPNAEYVLNG